MEAGRHTTLPEQSPYSAAPRCILLTACCQHNHASTRCPHTCACPPPTSCAGVHENFDDMTTQEASKRIQARTKKHPTPPTQAQLDVLQKNNYKGPMPKTKAAASEVITKLLKDSRKPTAAQLKLIEQQHLGEGIDLKSMTKMQASALIAKAVRPQRPQRKTSTTMPAQPVLPEVAPRPKRHRQAAQDTATTPSPPDTDDADDDSWITSTSGETDPSNSEPSESEWHDSMDRATSSDTEDPTDGNTDDPSDGNASPSE